MLNTINFLSLTLVKQVLITYKTRVHAQLHTSPQAIKQAFQHI